MSKFTVSTDCGFGVIGTVVVPRLRCLNPRFLVGGTVWGGLGGVASLEVVPLLVDTDVSSLMPFPAHSLSALFLPSHCELSQLADPALRLPATLTPDPSHDIPLSPWNHNPK